MISNRLWAGFGPDFAVIAHPLTELLKDGVSTALIFEFSDEKDFNSNSLKPYWYAENQINRTPRNADCWCQETGNGVGYF